MPRETNPSICCQNAPQVLISTSEFTAEAFLYRPEATQAHTRDPRWAFISQLGMSDSELKLFQRHQCGDPRRRAAESPALPGVAAWCLRALCTWIQVCWSTRTKFLGSQYIACCMQIQSPV